MSKRPSVAGRVLHEILYVLVALSLPFGILVSAVATALAYFGIVRKKDEPPRPGDGNKKPRECK